MMTNNVKENLYKGNFMEALADDAINLEDIYYHVHDRKMLSFHISRSKLS